MIGAPLPMSVEKETSFSVNICLQYGRSEVLSIEHVFSRTFFFFFLRKAVDKRIDINLLSLNVSLPA